ncbi:alpha-ketoglutarate-dependent dioxygenase AlkB [Kocuria rhizosphaericola]|uniref:alpha-ketoglutarate-dependent dioxygenase AlkB n=1 Tax=Kocuria rhizosphaericola TaxID=3376284 RepID=UPI00379F0F7C
MWTNAPTATGIPGLAVVPGYVDVSQQEHLLGVVDALPWMEDLRRRVQHYGYRYDYRSRAVTPESWLGPLPEWATELADRLAIDTSVARTPDQLIVNEYLPGQGIAAHTDCVPCFGDVVLSISLGSVCTMVFDQPASGRTAQMLLEPGALLVLSGDARYGWRHAIPARKSDIVDGRRVKRDRRVSLTFRTVIHEKRP